MGSRYLVPILPILFLWVAVSRVALWPRVRRPSIALLTVSPALNLAPVLVNWHRASTEYSPAKDSFTTGAEARD